MCNESPLGTKPGTGVTTATDQAKCAAAGGAGGLRAGGGTVWRPAAHGDPRGRRRRSRGVHAHGRRAPHRSHPLSCILPLPPTALACPPVPLHARPGHKRPVARSTEKRNTPVVPKVTQTNKLPDVIPMLFRKRDTNLTGNRHTILHTVIAIPLSHFRRATKKRSRAKVT